MTVPTGGCPRANFALILIPNLLGQEMESFMFGSSFNHHLIDAAGRTSQITKLSKWLTLATHAYLRYASDFFVFYFGFVPLPPHNHPTHLLDWRADAVDSLSRIFPFIYALNHGNLICRSRLSFLTS
jgi:hypothetical protein